MTSTINFNSGHGIVTVSFPDGMNFHAVSVLCSCKRGSHRWSLHNVKKPKAGDSLSDERNTA